MIFGEETTHEIEVNGISFKTGTNMKVLGVKFDYKLQWDDHINGVITKAKKLNSGLRFIRSKLNEKQFKRVLTSQFYSVCLYGSAAWLTDNTYYKDIR